MTEELPRLGTAVWIVRDGKVLLGKRRGVRGTDTWCPPGGHLEMYETLEDNVVRETMEEAGIEIENVRFISYTQNFSEEDKGRHYVTHYFRADWKAGEAQDLEPDGMGDWGWYSWGDLPAPLFYPTRTFVESGYNPLKF